jgi:hypothetical protein
MATKSSREINNREFVIAWMHSTSCTAVAKTLGITADQASARASYLRKMGVRLPKMTRQLKNNSLEVAQLNSIIKKALQEKQ